jgi:hypothetical protein
MQSRECSTVVVLLRFLLYISLRVHRIVIYEPRVKRHERIFEARATKERVFHWRECAEYVFPHRSLYKIFFETKVMSDLSCSSLCEYMALAKVSIELMAIYFPYFKIFNIPIGEIAFCKSDQFIKCDKRCSYHVFYLILFIMS